MYDSLNRILSGQSSGAGSTSWGDTYVIDAWGNLTNMNPISGKALGQNFQAAPASVQNQLNGFCNDAAGNLVLNTPCPTPPFTPSYYYDAENRLVWTSGYRYIYDGDGQRVEKCQAATATTACLTSGTTGTLYWRGTGSDTLAETDLGGIQQEEYIFFSGQRIARRDISSTGGTAGLHYYFSDHLGTHGVVETLTTSGGVSCDQDIDFYPYGGEENDYCTTPVPQHHKFTGKERDTESGLDNFGARYHASSLGRFMTPDWAEKPIDVPYANFGNPQSLNLYSYVQNNPTTVGDADGHCSGDDCAKITVAAEVTKQPELESSRSGRTSTATAEGEVQYAVKYSGKPMADTPIHEDVSNRSTRDGRPDPSTTTTRDDKTNKQGLITDQSSISVKTEAPSLPGTNAAEQTMTTSVFSKETTQTLTMTSPSGCSCSVTEKRTLSNASGDYKLTLQSPQTQKATVVPPPKTLPQNPPNQF